MRVTCSVLVILAFSAPCEVFELVLTFTSTKHVLPMASCPVRAFKKHYLRISPDFGNKRKKRDSEYLEMYKKNPIFKLHVDM